MDKGFTIIEITIALAILAIILSVVVLGFATLKTKSELDNAAQEIAGALRFAQSQAISSKSSSAFGVYFDNSAQPGIYVVFKGASYASRIASEDKTYSLPETVTFSSINFQGGSEVVFQKLTGGTLDSGSVSLFLQADNSFKSVYVDYLGNVSFEDQGIASENNRVKDSRHMHISYTRDVDETLENVTLTFDGSVVQALSIAQNLAGGQFFWEGTVNAGGQDQVVKIHTHSMDSQGAVFCVHRDGRYNNVSLSVSLSGDATGDIISYSAGGSTAFTSFYVSETNQQ